MHHRSVAAVGLACFIMTAGCGREPEPKPSMTFRLIVVNANVWPGDPSRPCAEALAVSGNRIVHVGTTNEVRELAGEARVIDEGDSSSHLASSTRTCISSRAGFGSNGEPTGVLNDNAMALVDRVVPPPSEAQGVTSVHHMGGWSGLIVIDRNLLTADPTSLAHARVTTTIVGGRVVHEAR